MWRAVAESGYPAAHPRVDCQRDARRPQGHGGRGGAILGRAHPHPAVRPDRGLRPHPGSAGRGDRDRLRLGAVPEGAGRRPLPPPATGGATGPSQRLPSDYIDDHFSFTYITDHYGIRNRHDIGVERIMWSSDYPHLGRTGPTRGGRSRPTSPACPGPSATSSWPGTPSACTASVAEPPTSPQPLPCRTHTEEVPS